MNKGRKEVRKIGWMEEIKKEEKKEGTNKQYTQFKQLLNVTRH